MWCAHSAWCDRPSELLTSEEDIPHSPIPTRGDQYSFATPLLEKGTALCNIQTQLGHSTVTLRPTTNPPVLLNC
jgi:hypothetical protein